MKQKAVLIAVSEYQPYGTRLDAPKYDIDEWERVLKRLGFESSNIRKRVDSQATRDVVMDDLRWLFDGLSEDDQPVLCFLGHGTRVEAHSGASEPYEEAILVYPAGGSLKAAEITDSDLTAIVCAAKVPHGVDCTIIVDCCFSGNLRIPVGGAHPLLVESAVKDLQVSSPIRRFGSLGMAGGAASRDSSKSGCDVEQPIIVAASARDTTAYEAPVAGKQHMLFTYAATKYITTALDQKKVVIFERLVHDIYPLAAGFEKQRPVIVGNTGRSGDAFPGQPGRARSAHAAVASRGLDENAVGSTAELCIQIEGIGCYADHRDEGDPYAKRLLFPHDGRTDPNARHLTFIEIPSEHATYSGTLAPKTGDDSKHVNDPTSYLRWELRGHSITIDETDSDSPFWPSVLYEQHVAKMTQVYPPYAREQYHPRSECFDTNSSAPLVDILDAFCDLVAGRLTIGPLDGFDTMFTRKTGEVTKTIESCRYTLLCIPLTEDVATIVVRPFGETEPVARIKVKRGGKVRIGNIRLGDIIGDNTTEDPAENFRLYYKLAPAVPPDPPLPAKPTLPTNFCSQTNWP
ncbi:MAG TPA: caspase family protein [Thermoanaerobaculia bacterium]|nr:caspase family protein [Thermoanaerobaculia bacterium]